MGAHYISTGIHARQRHRTSVIVAVAAAAIVAGCATKTPVPPPVVTPPPVAAPVPVVTPVAPPPVVHLSRRQEITKVLTALNQGNSGEARLEVVQMLAERPDDVFAKDMLRQIDTDPRVLLGERSYAYQIRNHETLSSIAARLLGNPNRFWALARYNNIAVPSTAGAGQTIQIPGTAPAPVPVRAPKAEAPRSTAQAPVADRPVTPRVDAAGAARLRRAGLDQMARGSIDKAVPLLERALALDPANATIQADLAQARKVQKAVRQN